MCAISLPPSLSLSLRVCVRACACVCGRVCVRVCLSCRSDMLALGLPPQTRKLARGGLVQNTADTEPLYIHLVCLRPSLYT